MTAAGVTALVLCGGGSARFGADKLVQPLGRSTVLGHLLATLPPSWAVVAIGGARPVPRSATWVTEEPPDGGPLAGIAAGMTVVTTDLVVVLGGDMPFVGPWAVRVAAQLSDSPDVDGVCARGADGRDNPLLTAYRAGALREALPEVTRNGRARLLLDRVGHSALSVPEEDLLDVDTPAALELARARLTTTTR